MEAFSLLKYWRSGSGTGAAALNAANQEETTKAIVTAAVIPCSSDGEDGPYFDLEFALPEEGSDAEEEPSERVTETCAGESSENETEDDDAEEELKFSLAGDECADQNELPLSQAEELFLKGNLVSIEPSSIILNESEETPKFPASLLKSATKIRVLLLKLKKSKSVNGILDKSEKAEKNEADGREIEEKLGKISGKFLTVKFRVEEVRMPLVSLFTHKKGTKIDPEESDEKKFSKEVVQKYLKMVKLKFSGQLSFSSKGSGGAAVPPAAEKGGEVVKTHRRQVSSNNLQAGLRVVRKHLGKSRSASAGVPPPPGNVASGRRDDSLLLLHDGIQSAILHCKKSFNGSRDGESSVLSRSVSDPSYEKSVIMSADCSSSSSSSGEENPYRSVV